MIWIRWAFLAANVVYSFAWLGWTAHSPKLSTFGKVSMGSIAAWQLIGVVLVIWLNFSAWHLLWWWIVGFTLNTMLVRVMCRLGFETTT